MRIWSIVTIGVGAGTALPIALHVSEHGALNTSQVALAFFLWLNTIICLWEICLLARIDLVEAQYARFAEAYRGRPMDRVMDFFSAKVPFSKVFCASTWAEIWSSYALFDEAYADRRSFGFFIDVGNGLTTLVPSLLVLYGMTFPILPARVLGIISLLIFYQMMYGALVYAGAFVFNRRYRGHSWRDVALFVGFSNALWIVFPVWGIVVSIGLIESNTYTLLWG